MENSKTPGGQRPQQAHPAGGGNGPAGDQGNHHLPQRRAHQHQQDPQGDGQRADLLREQAEERPAGAQQLTQGGLFRVLTLKLIGLLWLAVLLSNLFAEKFAAELMRWYQFYSVVVGLITTGILCHLAT